jgi:hypothetical protein
MTCRLLILFILMTACSNNQSCGGTAIDTPYPNPPPAGGDILQNSVQVHVMPRALNTLGRTLPILARNKGSFNLDGQRLVYPLTANTLGSNSPLQFLEGCADPKSSCPNSQLAINLNNLADGIQLTWLPNDATGRPGLRIAVNNLDLSLDAAVKINGSKYFPTAVCRVFDAANGAAVHVAQLTFDIRLATQNGRVSAVLADLVINLDPTQPVWLNVEGCDHGTCQDPICVGTICEKVCTHLNLFSQPNSIFNQLVNPLVEKLAPAIGQMIQESLVNKLTDLNLTRDIAITSPAASADVAQSLLLHFALGDSLRTQLNGASNHFVMPFNVAIGAHKNVCAGSHAPPALAPLLGPPPAFTGYVSVRAANNTSRLEGYDAALSVSEATVAQAVWSAFYGGFLCSTLTSEDIAKATNGQMILNSQFILRLRPDLGNISLPNAPMLLGFQATEPPVVHLGADGPTTSAANEPLINVDLKNLVLSLYMYIDESQQQVVQFSTDANVQLGVERSSERGLEIVLRKLSVTNVRQTYNELVPDVDLTNFVGSLVKIGLDQVGGAIKFPIDFSALLQVTAQLPLEVRLNAIHRDLGPTGAAYLTAYATLCSRTDVKDPANAVCHIKSPVLPSSVAVKRVRLGSLDLDVNNQREYQYRVDGGIWSSYQQAPNSVLMIESPQLLLTGAHVVQLRERIANNYMSTSEPQDVHVVVPADLSTALLNNSSCQQTNLSAWWAVAAAGFVLARRRLRN